MVQVNPHFYKSREAGKNRQGERAAQILKEVASRLDHLDRPHHSCIFAWTTTWTNTLLSGHDSMPAKQPRGTHSLRPLPPPLDADPARRWLKGARRLACGTSGGDPVMRHEPASTQPARPRPRLRARARDLADFCPHCLRVCTPRLWVMTRSYTVAVYRCPRCGATWPCWFGRD